MSSQRKIMSLGASLVVTLPKPWVSANKLVKGEIVSVKIQKDQTLLISPGPGFEGGKRELHLLVEPDESESSIERNIIAGFLDGYTTIRLTSKTFFSIDQQNAIREISSKLYMMIVESEAGHVVLETLLDESKMSVSTNIERMHVITYSMCRDVLNSLKEPNIGLIKTVLSLENDVDRLMFLTLRLIRLAALRPALAVQMGLDLIDCLDIQTLVHRIERIADHVAIIAKSLIGLIESGAEIPEEVLETLVEAAGVAFSSYDRSVMSFILRDVSDTNEIINNEREIEDLYMKITPLQHPGDLNDISSISNIILMRESIRKISHYAADIAELTINRTYNI